MLAILCFFSASFGVYHLLDFKKSWPNFMLTHYLKKSLDYLVGKVLASRLVSPPLFTSACASSSNSSIVLIYATARKLIKMGGGDLNLKKSWHPALQKNQERVWKQEKQALEERRKIETIQKERAEERSILEVQRMHEAAGGKPASNRVEWMYSGPSDNNGVGGVAEEREAFLLGKSRVDTLLKQRNNEVEQAQKTSAENKAGFGNVGTARDAASKIRDDPMLAIKKREQASYDAMINDPAKRRQLLKQAGIEGKEKTHRHRHHDERDRDGGHRSKRRRYCEDRDDERARRYRHHRSQRYRSYSRSRSRSPLPYKRNRERDGGQSRSREYDRRRDGRISRYSSESRSQSPPRRRNRGHSFSTPPRRSEWRSPSPYSRRRSNDIPPRSSRRSISPVPRRRSPSPHSRRNDRPPSGAPRPPPPKPDAVDDEQKEKERAAKLAAMQSNAAALDQDRRARLETSSAQDAIDEQRDSKVRSDQGRFMSGVRRQADDINLGEAMRRRGVTAGGGGD